MLYYRIAPDQPRLIVEALSSLLRSARSPFIHDGNSLIRRILECRRWRAEFYPNECGWVHVVLGRESEEGSEVLFVVFAREKVLLALQRLAHVYIKELAVSGYSHLDAKLVPRLALTLLTAVQWLRVPIGELLEVVDGLLAMPLRAAGLSLPPVWAGRIYRVVYPLVSGVRAAVAYTIDTRSDVTRAWLCTRYGTWKCWKNLPVVGYDDFLAQLYQFPRELAHRILAGDLTREEFEAEMALVRLSTLGD